MQSYAQVTFKEPSADYVICERPLRLRISAEAN